MLCLVLGENSAPWPKWSQHHRFLLIHGIFSGKVSYINIASGVLVRSELCYLGLNAYLGKWHLREIQHNSNTMWIDFNTYWTLLLLDNAKSMCENVKWHLWAAMTATWHLWVAMITYWHVGEL